MISEHRKIRQLLQALVEGIASELEINAIVRISFLYASQRLRQLMRSGKLHLHSFGIATDGIAYDCIAELFQRDEVGQFVELADYFSGDRDLASLSEEEITSNFRCLIFSRVNHGIFRLYREDDPVLARIIRSLKLAVKADRGIKQLELLGQTYIYCCLEEERNDHLPEFPLDELEREVITSVNAKVHIPKYLRLVLSALNNQDLYRRFYSLIDIAVVFKRIVAQLELATPQAEYTENGFPAMDVQQVLSESAQTMKEQLYRKYVASAKVLPDTFEKYWLALEELMYNTFVLNNATDLSHPELLKKHFHGLDTAEYRRVHRTHFEYMARIVRNHVKEQLRELL